MKKRELLFQICSLTWKDHVALGNDLRKAYHQTLSILSETKKSSPVHKSAKRICDRIGLVKNRLDSNLFENFPKKSTQELSDVYYGKGKE